MNEDKKQIKKLRIVEGQINSHLYLISALITLITMAMIITEFFSRGTFSPAKMNLFYLGVLIIYSFHKELVRWLGKRKIERQGEYFVYAWIALTALLYVVNFLSKDYFIYSASGQSLTILRDISVLTLEVLAIFIITRCSKLLKIFLAK